MATFRKFYIYMDEPLKPIPVEIASWLADLYFDGKRFWHKHHSNRWEALGTESVTRLLRVKYDMSNKRPESKSSEIDRALRDVEENHRIIAAAPFVHDNRDILSYREGVFVNTCLTKPIQPAESGDPKDFPWLDKFYRHSWDAPQEIQRDHYLAWLQRFYVSALQGRLAAGQTLILAGEVDQGKTFNSIQVIGRLLGGCSDALQFLKGGTKFNEEASNYAVWTADDPAAMLEYKERAMFAGNLKAVTANQHIRVEGKYLPAVTIPWMGRPIVTVNTDVRSLSVLPDLRGGIADKLMLLRWGGEWRPEFGTREENEERIGRELPFFARWLLDWKAPEYVKAGARFGVVSYHHPSLEEEANAASPAARLFEIITLFNQSVKGETDWFTTTGLRKRLREAGFFEVGQEFSRDRMREGLEELVKVGKMTARTHDHNREFLLGRE